MRHLVRMRLTGFVRGGRSLAPFILILVELGVIYGGGPSPAAVAYGYSAVALFPALAWQTKLVLDAEPDGQRRLARLAVGARREALAGLLTATAFALAVCVLAMGAPWIFNGIDTSSSLRTGIALGVLAHLLAVPPAVAVGALASRVVTGNPRNGVAVLVIAVVLVIILGLRSSVAPWLVPPVMATARVLNAMTTPSAETLLLLIGWAIVWCAAAFAGYGWLRRARS